GSLRARCARLPGVGAERGELVAPERLDAREPRLQLGEAFAAQAVDAHPRVALAALLLDQAAGSQHAEMSAHRRRAQRQRGGQLAGAARAAGEQLDGAAPGGVGERGQGGVERGRTRHRAVAYSAGGTSSSGGTSRTWVAKTQRWPSGS